MESCQATVDRFMLFPRDPYLMGLTPVATASESSAQTLQIARTMTAEAAPSAPAAEPQRFVGQAANAQPAEANAEAPGTMHVFASSTLQPTITVCAHATSLESYCVPMHMQADWPCPPRLLQPRLQHNQ